MKSYTGFEYLLIDVANNYNAGLDKQVFEHRIKWGADNLYKLEELAEGKTWKNKPLYLKAVQAVRKVLRGEPTGHLVGLDAVCSGMQIMSVMTGCLNGAEATGLINPNERSDAYTKCTKLMNDRLAGKVSIPREDVKQAAMTALYGSKKEPETLFGKDTDALQAFKQALVEMAPGAVDLLGALVESWQPWAKEHCWKLPDGFDAYVKVVQRKKHRIEVEEAMKTTFTYVYYENKGSRRDVKNAANVIHSVDAWILRSLIRHCSYDERVVKRAQKAIYDELTFRGLGGSLGEMAIASEKFNYYLEQYARSQIPDVVILPYLTEASVAVMEIRHLKGLSHMIGSMLKHKPFEVVTVHDDFKAHPNNLNALRLHYRDILIQLADSNLAEDILSQLHGVQGYYSKQGPDIGRAIHAANYAIC